MKTLKSFSLVIVLAVLLSSCVVKSLHAFYTSELIHFEPKIIGNWQDSENAHWSIKSFREVILSENNKSNPSELKEDELKMYNKYKDGYVMIFKKDSTESTFLAMPFKINDQLFLDFTPIEDREIDKLKNDLYRMHLINSHSLAKLDINSENKANIKWLDEDKLEALIKENRIKIKYETIGFGETTLLTASSDELVKFIEKYMASEDEDKWKTRVEVSLTRE